MKFHEFKEKFRINELEVIESDFWIASIRPVQVTLGALVISLKEPMKSIDQVSNEEGADFFSIVQRVQELTHKSFKHEKTNLLALMMVDPFVHFHFIPRYSEAKVFQGVRFADKSWPGPPDLKGELCPDVLLEYIRAEMVGHL